MLSQILGLHGWEWLIIFGIILLLFGATKLPALMRSMGRSIAEFKKGVKEGEEEVKQGEIKEVSQEKKK